MTNKVNWIRFLEKTLLVANISLKVIFGMLYLTFSDTDIDFLDWELRWRTYTTKKALLTTKYIELVEKEKCIVAALDLKY